MGKVWKRRRLMAQVEEASAKIDTIIQNIASGTTTATTTTDSTTGTTGTTGTTTKKVAKKTANRKATAKKDTTNASQTD